ncbi:MAG: molecular chaperone TorD family protein [Deltaproteobacteria bacterium]|nr:molecular chaperone TorD family protein [Deltaproteobacteria bacterium]
MDIQNSENKRFNYAVLEGVEIMCRVFWGPDIESCRHMIEGDFFQSFEIILTKPEAKPSGILDNINSIINKFDTHQSLFHHLNECYVRLFVNSKEGITTPLYQSCYEFENAPMMGESAVKMNKRFKSKGLSMENRVHEPPDHLAIELEYLFFLLQESSVGLNNNLDKFVSNEAASFATETMLPWVIVFNQRLKSITDDCRFYSLASGILILLLGLISNK